MLTLLTWPCSLAHGDEDRADQSRGPRRYRSLTSECSANRGQAFDCSECGRTAKVTPGVPPVRNILDLLGVEHSNVRQVRMIRWGHAAPIPKLRMFADGTVGHLQRPLEDRFYFVNQDNWSLPAVENCLLDAEIYVPQIEAAL